MKDIPKDEMAGLKEGGDLVVYTNNSTVYSFKESHYHVSGDSLYGKGYATFRDDSNSKVAMDVAIALTNIEEIQRDELNPTSTTWLIIGGILLLTSVVLGIQVIQSLESI
jgi:hypothetical protein